LISATGGRKKKRGKCLLIHLFVNDVKRKGRRKKNQGKLRKGPIGPWIRKVGEKKER